MLQDFITQNGPQFKIYGLFCFWKLSFSTFKPRLTTHESAEAKNLPASAGDTRNAYLIPMLERSPGGEHGNLLQYSCLENPIDREAWKLESVGSSACLRF